MHRSLVGSLVLLLGLGVTVSAAARPSAPRVLCETYPGAADCEGRVASCSTCHTSTWPVSWNAFGSALVEKLAPGDAAAFASELGAALSTIGADDADGDGISNEQELDMGTNPGDVESAWPYCSAALTQEADAPVRSGYDFARALTRLSILYCGHSPSYDDLAALASQAPGDSYETLHTSLSRCLDSAFWRDRGLARLADPRIRPVSAVGYDSELGIVIGDYGWDYRLWSYVLTGDRDARDLLRADYHVRQRDDGTLERVEGVIAPTSRTGPEPLEPEHRAGMITTQWFFAVNTMFSPLPRTSAAQAYRAYLGLDLSRQEGVVEVAGEPRDLDRKGVQQAECAACHSTLDPLSYAFASYEGIDFFRGTGTFNPDRPRELIADWDDPQAMLLGQPVEDLVEWAHVAADSDAFARNLATLFFKHAFERLPSVAEREEFEALWRGLLEDQYSANRLIHHLIDLDAFGGLAP
jgi:hypothetical protein